MIISNDRETNGVPKWSPHAAVLMPEFSSLGNECCLVYCLEEAVHLNTCQYAPQSQNFSI